MRVSFDLAQLKAAFKLRTNNIFVRVNRPMVGGKTLKKAPCQTQSQTLFDSSSLARLLVGSYFNAPASNVYALNSVIKIITNTYLIINAGKNMIHAHSLVTLVWIQFCVGALCTCT